MNNETIIIHNTFKMLEMDDAIYEFNKYTPYYLRYNNTEYAPYNLYLEESCDYGNNCFYKKDPLVCCKNHQTNNNIIVKEQILPNYLCKYERPWKNLNGYQMRCQNIYCWFSHLKGREQIISYIAQCSNYY